MREKRDETIILRLSKTEKNRIYEKMLSMGIRSLSAYIRKMALDGYCLNLDLPQLRRMAYLLQNCSNNLNQYAKRANECGKVYAADMEDLRQRLDELIDIGKQILSKLAAMERIGEEYVLPGANELASNGVHHGTFRHEQGDATLSSEQGWQMDASYQLKYGRWSVYVSPFVNWFSNYIFLRPTGEWSVLPHTGQIYRYTQTEALFAGAEASVELTVLPTLNYRISGEYVYTYNCDERIPLSFSPPATLRNTLTWQRKRYMLYAEWQSITKQNRVDRNEDRTPGANLFHIAGSLDLPVAGTEVEITLTVRNLFNTRYYNHLSFYRKVEIPEPGRNFQLLIKVPFKKLFK